MNNMLFSVNQNYIFDVNDADESKFLTPFQRKSLLKNLQSDLPPEYRRRIYIMLLADMGKTQSNICEIVGCSQEMARYWIGIAEAGMAHKWNQRPIGRPKIVSSEYMARLQELVSNSPREYGYAFGDWTGQWLSKHLARELGIKISDRHINRLLKKMGLATRKSKKEMYAQQQYIENQNLSVKISDLKHDNNSSDYWSLNLLQNHQ